MGWGKILGLAALGVGAVAAAPFTGGGSILAATGAAASLAGAGTVAAAVGAGAAGAAAGAIMSENEEEEQRQERRRRERAEERAEQEREEREAAEKKAEREKKARKKAEEKAAKIEEKEKAKKAEDDKKKAKEKAKQDKIDKKKAEEKKIKEAKINVVKAITALTVSMAHIDGKYAEEEEKEIDEYIDTLNESEEYEPEEIYSLTAIVDNPPSLEEALAYLDNVNPNMYGEIRDMLKNVMKADGNIAPEEKDFLKQFDLYIN